MKTTGPEADQRRFRAIQKPPFPNIVKTRNHSFAGIVLGAAILAASTSGRAAIVTWNGGDGEYTVASNWDTDSLPNTNGGDTARIDSGNVTYTPGGDLHVHNGGSLEINGGSWTQVGGIAWIQLADGTLAVNGGTFNQGTSGNIVRNAATTINVSAGVANFSGNFLNDADMGAFIISGGTVNIANEFKPITTFTMTTGSLNATLISFADGPGGIEFSGGSISVNGGGAYSGFYGGGTKSLNFTTGSTGALFFSDYTLAALAADNFLGNGTIRHAGDVSPSSFAGVEADGGVWVTLVPEPGIAAYLTGCVGAFLLIRRRNP